MVNSVLLLEDSSFLLLEDGNRLLLETTATPGYRSMLARWMGGVASARPNNNQPPTLLGNGKKQGGYHSWLAHYENELLKKEAAEEKTRIAEIEGLKDQEVVLQEKLQVTPKHHAKIVRNIEAEIAQLMLLLQQEEVLLIELQNKIAIRRKSILLLVFMMAAPLSSVSLN